MTTYKEGILKNDKPIICLEQYIEKIVMISSKWDRENALWFRGVSNSGHKLIPGLYRNTSTVAYNISREKHLFRAFTRRGYSFLLDINKFTDWQWYQIMQHHGVATRLLDWTYGSLTALYFAVRNPVISRIPAVWVIDPTWLNIISGIPDGKVCATDSYLKYDHELFVEREYLFPDKMNVKYPVAILPPHSDSRIKAQDGVFTIHGLIKDGFSTAMKKCKDDVRIAKITIKTYYAEDIKAQLYQAGISEETLFPDLDGLARQLNWEYS